MNVVGPDGRELPPPNATFAEIGLHPAVCGTLAARGITVPLELQRRTLHETVHDYADLVAEALPHSGRHTLLCAMAAHSLLSSDDLKSSRVIIVANNQATATKLVSVMQPFEPIRAQPILIDDRSGLMPKAVHAATNGLAYIGSLVALNRILQQDALSGVLSLFVEDVVHHEPKVLQMFLDRVITAAPQTNMFMLSTQPASQVNIGVRYLLRRKNRRYYFQHPGRPEYCVLLCEGQEDRLALILQLVQMKGLNSVMVLTHNREVRDLKAHISQQLGCKTFSVQRNTSFSDHDRVLSDFLRSQYCVLVGMDAYTGIDLMDVDLLIQMYPPQKSMVEEEWLEYTNYLRATSNPAKPTLVVTLAAQDELPLVHHFHKRMHLLELPVLNVAPTHPQLEQIVRNPMVVLAEKQAKEKNGVPATAPPPPPPPPPHMDGIPAPPGSGGEVSDTHDDDRKKVNRRKR